MKLGFCFYINVIACTDVFIHAIIYSLQNCDGGGDDTTLIAIAPREGGCHTQERRQGLSPACSGCVTGGGGAAERRGAPILGSYRLIVKSPGLCYFSEWLD